ncbi:MAG: glutamate synthase large subunit, partial [Gammaproteobacteria bacterium]|nr:glutamate synthase large subunit [Gammaproteobacteria bacterium]
MHAPARGLCKDSYERDSCGFGLIASLDDEPSHWLVSTAITSLNRLTHRGAVAEDGKTGDGCGLLLKRPERFLRAVAAQCGIAVGERFAAGLVFLAHEDAAANAARAALAAQLERQGLEVAGWRVVPTDAAACGAEALQSLPRIEQLFVNCADAQLDEAAFNRRLFMARRLAEKACVGDRMFYVPSLSASTLVYKAMVMPQHLTQFYPDLEDARLESSVAVFHQRFSTNTLPQWRLAHPFRFLAHNGEINTIA